MTGEARGDGKLFFYDDGYLSVTGKMRLPSHLEGVNPDGTIADDISEETRQSLEMLSEAMKSVIGLSCGNLSAEELTNLINRSVEMLGKHGFNAG
jgi:hypothetical protein